MQEQFVARRQGWKLKPVLSVVSVMLMLIAVGINPAVASPLLFDRGLPAANLNNGAGADRSNVAWAFGADPAGSWLAGDDFKIGGSGAYLVDTIRIWSTSASGLSVWFGAAGGTIEQLSAAPSISAVTYADGKSYQVASGSFLPLYQLDINLNRVLDGETTYQFFLDGTNAPSVYPFIHASNAARSGSPQQGADDQMLYAFIPTGSGIATEVGTWNSRDDGWDKSSDANIQVYGAPVPEPATIVLLGAGLGGLAIWRRKQRN